MMMFVPFIACVCCAPSCGPPSLCPLSLSCWVLVFLLLSRVRKGVLRCVCVTFVFFFDSRWSGREFFFGIEFRETGVVEERLR